MYSLFEASYFDSNNKKIPRESDFMNDKSIDESTVRQIKSNFILISTRLSSKSDDLEIEIISFPYVFVSINPDMYLFNI